MVAGMEMRPCSSSVWRRRAKFFRCEASQVPEAKRPLHAPLFSKVRSGEAVDRAQLRGDVSHGGQHEDAAVPQSGLAAAAREVCGIAIRREASQYLKESACQRP